MTIDPSQIVLPPKLGECFCVQATTTTQFLDLNVNLTGASDTTQVRNFFNDRILNLQADGGAVLFAFTNDNAANINPTATGVPSTTAPQPTIPFRLPADQERNYKAPANFRYIAYRTASGTAYLRGHVSSVQGLLPCNGCL